MREINFRAWDGTSWVYSECISKDGINWWILNNEDDNWLACLDPQQYTGLKDKNGKEIYEGDILECTSELLTNFGKTKTGRYETTYKQVIWLTDSWGYRVLKSKHIVEGAERKGLEVAIKFGVICGNIYENPELLER